jgi:peptide/nickel transport system permease protein
MFAYILRRLLVLPVLWLGITLLIFMMLEPLGPYQRLQLFLSADPEQVVPTDRLTEEEVQLLFEKHGLLDPFYVQYGRWLGNVFQGNLGWSKSAKKPVVEAFLERLPATVELTMYAVAPLILIGIWLGVFSAVNHNKMMDHVTRLVAISGVSLPTFVFAIAVLVIFYGQLDWFQPGRLSLWANDVVFSDAFVRYTGINTIDAIVNWRWDIWWDAAKHLILPVITLSYLSWATLLRVTRSSMLETLKQDYITTARAKGLPERSVVHKHAKRNALLPVATISGFVIYGLLTGVFITETVFSYRGLGYWGVASTLSFDVPAVIGIVLFATTLIVLTNLVVDILYTFIDPRVRYD